MLLTFNQVLFLVLTIAAVVAVTFLTLFLVQLRRTAREGEKTLVELRELVRNLQEIEHKVNLRIDDVGEIIESSKKTLSGLSEVTFFLTTRVIRPASKFWPILFPLVRLGWQQLRKRKEKKHG